MFDHDSVIPVLEGARNTILANKIQMKATNQLNDRVDIKTYLTWHDQDR